MTQGRTRTWSPKECGWVVSWVEFMHLVHVAVSALVGAKTTSYAEDIGLLGFALCFGFGLGFLGCQKLRKC